MLSSQWSFNTDADNLLKLLRDNPDLPLVVVAGPDANDGSDTYDTCSFCKAEIGEYLDYCVDFNEGKIYTDRHEFYNHADEYGYCDGSEYDSYWKPCIIYYVDN